MSSEKPTKKIETKDWIYLFIISLFLQFIIYYFSFIYGGSTKALGYISFAGTLISIILAVIAIGYTYGESIKQKTSSDQLLVEIAGLREIKEKLAGQVDILENIADLKTAVEDTKNAVIKFDFASEFEKLESQLRSEKNPKSSLDIKMSELEEIIQRFSVVTDHRFLEIIYSLENGQISSFDDFFKYFNNNEYDKKARHELLIMYMSHYQIGNTLGIFKNWQPVKGVKEIYQRKYPENSNRFSPEDSFTKICKKVLYSEA